MAIQEGPDTHNEKAVKTHWPVEEGLIAGTTKQVNDPILRPEGLEGGASNVLSRYREGI